jgi:hypothetical protein
VTRVERRAARSRKPTWWPGGLVGLLLLPQSAVGLVGMLAVLLAVGTVALVVGPAIWSRKQFRRDAALAVLERLLRQR